MNPICLGVHESRLVIVRIAIISSSTKSVRSANGANILLSATILCRKTDWWQVRMSYGLLDIIGALLKTAIWQSLYTLPSSMRLNRFCKDRRLITFLGLSGIDVATIRWAVPTLEGYGGKIINQKLYTWKDVICSVPGFSALHNLCF